MINILLCGCGGRMGKAISESVKGNNELRIVCGVDPVFSGSNDYPVFEKISDAPEIADVIIDFSHHSAIRDILEYAKDKKIPAVIATTGHTDEEKALILEYSKDIAIFRSGNMSLGINLLTELCRRAENILGEKFDVEIIEKHHNKKLDAPSGTALMIADAIKEASERDMEYIYDRHSTRGERKSVEIGISSVRGGNIVGEHEVMFIGSRETVTLSHSANSREVFAEGALKAAAFMIGKAPGLYDMTLMIKELI